MPLFVVYRLDRQDGQAAEIRAETRPLHREYIGRFKEKVRLGGPLLGPAGEPCGGVMVVEAEHLDQVLAIVNEDPFEKAGLSARIEVHPFRWQTNPPNDLSGVVVDAPLP